MRHAVREEQGSLIVSFDGEFDLEHAPEARRVLLDSIARSERVLVDLAEVRYIDSSGVASLVEAFQVARSSGISFALACVSAPALRVLELARLDRVFTIHDNVANGLRV